MHSRLCAFFLRAQSGQHWIRDQRGETIPLALNEGQLRLHALALDMALARRPVRIRVLKGRKIGVTTWKQVQAVDHCAHTNGIRAIVLAHAAPETLSIFDIGKLAARQYKYPDGVACADVNEERIRFPQTGSEYRCRTAGGYSPESGGTPQDVHLSERPKWEKHRNENYVSVVNAVPRDEQTIVIDEATARGCDSFWSAFEAGMRGDADHQWESLFLPWYLDARLEEPVSGGFAPTPDELRIVGRAHEDGIELSYEALQWRRAKIAEIGEAIFRQEYPSTPEEAVQATEGLVLPDLASCVIDSLPFNIDAAPPAERVGGIDFGYHDPTVIWSGVYRDQTLWLANYWRGSETLADEQAAGLLPSTTYYCDPSGVQARQELARAATLRNLHCRFVAAPRSRNVGEDFQTAELHTIVRAVERGRLRILRSAARQLLVEARSFAWNPATGRPDETRGEAWGHYDSVRALQYLCMGVMRRGSHLPRLREPVQPSRREQFSRW